MSENEDVGEFYKILSMIEQAFCDPFQVTKKPVNGEAGAEGVDDAEDEGAAKA